MQKGHPCSPTQPHAVAALEWWWGPMQLSTQPHEAPCSPTQSLYLNGGGTYAAIHAAPNIVPCSPTQSLYLNGGVNPYSQFNPHSPTCPLQLSHRPTQPHAITLLEWWWGAHEAIHVATLVEWWCGPMQPSTQPHTVTLLECW